MKILFVGQLGQGQTSRMRMEALRELGHTIIPLNSQAGWANSHWLVTRIQQKLSRGPIISQLNQAVIALARQHNPDLLWGEKQEYLKPDTLLTLRRINIKTLHYTPDPYFYRLAHKRTRLTNACMPLFDYVVTSKRYELDDYHRTCRRVFYLPLGYSERVHRPVVPLDSNTRKKFTSDIAFIGGWEPRREILLNAIAFHTNCNLKIWGYSWDHVVDGRWTPRRDLRLRLLAGKTPFQIRKNCLLATALQGGEVYDDSYAWALSGARINIGFLRHTWPDQHTTRSFEIPACGSMMIADRTDEHQAFFREGQEAEFFSFEEELVDKVRFYLRNEACREKIAYQGYQRCQTSGYSYKERLKQVLAELD